MSNDKTKQELEQELDSLRKRLEKLETLDLNLRAANQQLEEGNQGLIKLTEELKQQRNQAQKYLDIAAVMFVVLDNRGRITQMNRKGCEILGRKDESCLIGKSWFSNCLPLRAQKSVRDVFKQLMSGDIEPVEYYENEVLCADGSERIIAFHNTLLYNGKGEIAGVASFGEDITERINAVNALQKSEKHLEQAIKDGDLGMWDWDISTGKVVYSDPWVEMLGYTPGELAPDVSTWEKLMHPDDKEGVMTVLNRHLEEEGFEYKPEFRLKTKSGDWKWINARGRVFKWDKDNNPLRMIGIHVDISQRKKMEGVLKRNEERYRLLYETSGDAIMTLEPPNWYFTSGNNKIVEMFGVKNEEEFIALTPWQTSPEYQPDRQLSEVKAKEMIETAIEKGEHLFEWTHKRVGGEEFFATVLLNKIETGSKVFLQARVHDITDRKLAEEKLRKKEQQLSLHLQNTPIGSICWDLNFRVTEWNTAAESIFGYSREEAMGKHPTEIILLPNSVDLVNKVFQELLGQSGGTRSTNDNLRKDGETIICDWFNTTLTDSDGVVIGAASLINDITEHKHSERELRLKETAIASSINGVGMTDLEGRLIYANDALVKMWGFDSDDKVLGRLLPEFWEGEGIFKILKVLQDKGFAAGEDTGRKKDGSIFPVQFSANIVKDDDGKPEYMFGSFLDITEKMKNDEKQNKLQDQLYQSQRMEAVGKLAGGVAHDFNNLLTVIKGHSQLGIMKLNELDPLYSDIVQINEAADRAAKLTKQLLLYSRRQPLDLKPLNVNETVENLLKMLKRLIGENINVITELNKNEWTINGDSGNIEQIIMNIAVNGRDAMPDSGSMTFKTENLNITANYKKQYPYAYTGQFVCLSIQDTGSGMDKETQKHIFEPFYTTKGIGKGTGLGMSVVYGIVREHGGWINIFSEPGQGAIFKIYLPAVFETQQEGSARERIDIMNIRGKGERILLVEDEETVLKTLKRMLAENGYEVVSASNAEKAISIFRKEEKKFDLVFTDTILPGMNGLELIQDLHAQMPELRVLVGSGYTGEKVHREILKEKSYTFLQKPYEMSELLMTLREILTQPGR